MGGPTTDLKKPAAAAAPYHRPQSRYLKFVLLAFCTVLLLGLLYWPEIELLLTQPTAQEAKHEKKIFSETKITSKEVLKPRFMSVDKDNRPYTVTADKAINQSEEEVSLEKVKSSMTLENGETLLLTSKTGFVHPGKEGTADLYGDVNLVHSQGHEIITQEAHIDFDKGTVVSREPVAGKSIFGTIQGEGLHLHKEQKVIKVLGKSKVVFQKSSPKNNVKK